MKQSCLSIWVEALLAILHVINLNPPVSLNIGVLDKIWFDKNVSYDHLHVLNYKAFFYVLEDERSKLNAKTMQCIFIGYGQDEFGYKLYDFVEKKCDVKFIKDQTIEVINKVEKIHPRKM